MPRASKDGSSSRCCSGSRSGHRPQHEAALVLPMHDIRFIRDNPDAFDEGLTKRGLAPLSAALIALDERRRAAVAALQAAQERRNALSKEIGQAKAKKDEARAAGADGRGGAPQGRRAGAGAGRTRGRAPRSTRRSRTSRTRRTLTCRSARTSTTTSSATASAPRATSRRPKEHFEIGEAMGLMDFETAAKLSGSRFVVLRGAAGAAGAGARASSCSTCIRRSTATSECNPPLLVRDAGHVRHGAAAEVRGGPVLRDYADG